MDLTYVQWAVLEPTFRPLRRAKRRWKIERLFALLHNCRRVVIRWERHVGNYLGMVQLACTQILIRAFMRSLLDSRENNDRARARPLRARWYRDLRRS